MNTNKLVAWGLVVSLGVALLSEVNVLDTESGIMLAGIGLWVFGVWAAVKLFNLK